MAQAPDSAPDPQAQATMSTGGIKLVRRRLRDEIAENPLLSLLLGLVFVNVILFEIALVVALLIFLLTST